MDRPIQEFFCIEIFAGTGRLTAALKSLGLRNSFGVDLKLPPKLQSPIVKYDLLNSEHVDIVKSLIAKPECIFVHFAPPCGTSSRARLIQRRGRYNPPILRTETHPNGIPGLSGTLLARVLAANALYAVTCDLVKWCLEHDTSQSKTPADLSCGTQTRFVTFCKHTRATKSCSIIVAMEAQGES